MQKGIVNINNKKSRNRCKIPDLAGLGSGKKHKKQVEIFVTLKSAAGLPIQIEKEEIGQSG